MRTPPGANVLQRKDIIPSSPCNMSMHYRATLAMQGGVVCLDRPFGYVSSTFILGAQGRKWSLSQQRPHWGVDTAIMTMPVAETASGHTARW